MALSGLTLDPLRAYGKEIVLLPLRISVGTGGAVTAVSGKGWKSDGTAGRGPNNGSVTRTGTGAYRIVLPGSGSVHGILAFVQIDGDGYGGMEVEVVTDATSRGIDIVFLAEGSPLDPTNADIQVLFVVQNSPL